MGIYKTRGEAIRSLRIKAGLSQDDLAKKLDTTKQTIYKYEAGVVTNIPSDKIETMAQIFGVSPAVIMGWDDDQKTGQEEDYYIDPEVAAKAQEIYEDPDLRILLDAKRDLTKEDLDAVINIVKALKAKEGK